jgi:ABC-type transporter Mla subunit MlaD
VKRAAAKVRRLAAGLERRVVLIGVVMAMIGIALTVISAAAVNRVPFIPYYQLRAVLPPDGPPLKPGDAVRIGGQRVGTISSVDPRPRDSLVTMDILPKYSPIGRDARAFIRLKSAAYIYFVELEPGDRRDPFPEGGTIPKRRVAFGTDPLEIVRSFDRASRRAFRRTLTATGGGIAGRGRTVNAALQDLEPALEQGTPQLEALNPRGGEPGDLVDGTNRTARGLAGRRPDDLERTIPAARSVLETVAGRRVELGRTLDLVPPLEHEVLTTSPVADPLLADAERLVVDLPPLVADLDRVLPEVNGLLSAGDELRSETSEITSAADPALREAPPLFRDLRPAAASLRPLAETLIPTAAELARYDRDLLLSVRGLLSVGEQFYPQGDPPDNPALRIAPIFCDHRPREPFPEPGEATERRADEPRGCSLR